MHWDRLFEDLEGQLAAGWEAERAALDAESERLRIAGIALRTRLCVLRRRSARVALHLADGGRHSAVIRAVGADWLGVHQGEGSALLLAPLTGVIGIELDHGMLLESLDDAVGTGADLRERMTLGFVLRGLARRRLALHIALHDGTRLHGTVDRAGSDHLDLAEHDPGEPRRARSVRGFRIIPFSALAWIRTERDAL